ncbi:hypothetical protein ACFRAE_09360 [Sphingobacterium sp. HJSM2_6]|uniref:hypothetical protein n=1 Tax=Sphingobacterium sp. HJSM2_6 TaxID=3366264 RepID=UPI003BD0AF10
MKKVLSIIAVLAGLSFSAFAQEVNNEPTKEVKNRKQHRTERKEFKRNLMKSPEEMAQFRTERLDKQLKFSESQKKQVYALELEKSKKILAKREAIKAERQAKLKAFKEEQETFKNLLTPEQQEIYKNKLADNRKHKFQRGGKNDKFHNMRRSRPDHTKPVVKDHKEIELDSSAS